MAQLGRSAIPFLVALNGKADLVSLTGRDQNWPAESQAGRTARVSRVADEHGTHLAAVPLIAALPPTVVGFLKEPEKVVPETRFEEYRRFAAECRGKAEDAADPDDKMAWLKLADAWLQMLPQTAHVAGWPKASADDSKASH